MKMRKKHIYVVLTYTKRLVKGSRTEWEAIEKCEFVDALKRRHIDSSEVILDLTDRIIYKNRTDLDDYNSFYDYVKKSYPQQMTELENEYEEIKPIPEK
jgi:hypothetical protein